MVNNPEPNNPPEHLDKGIKFYLRTWSRVVLNHLLNTSQSTEIGFLSDEPPITKVNLTKNNPPPSEPPEVFAARKIEGITESLIPIPKEPRLKEIKELMIGHARDSDNLKDAKRRLRQLSEGIELLEAIPQPYERSQTPPNTAEIITTVRRLFPPDDLPQLHALIFGFFSSNPRRFEGTEDINANMNVVHFAWNLRKALLLTAFNGHLPENVKLAMSLDRTFLQLLLDPDAVKPAKEQRQILQETAATILDSYNTRFSVDWQEMNPAISTQLKDEAMMVSYELEERKN